MTATTLQTYIDARQRLDTIEYGLRALRAQAKTGTWMASDELETFRQRQYAKQIRAACILTGLAWDGALEPKLKLARDKAKAELKAAKDARLGRRQERLALAEAA